MSLEQITNVAHIFSAISLVVSALVLVRELQVTNKLARAGNTQNLVSLSSPFNMALIQDRAMAEFYVNGAANYHAMDAVDRYRYKSLIIHQLILHENIYYQHRQRLLDNHSYQPWAVELEFFVQQQALGIHWNDEMRSLFQKEFANHVTGLIERGRLRQYDSTGMERAAQ